MNSVVALPIGGEPVLCQLCGLQARPPIVIPEVMKSGATVTLGLCRNLQACKVRQSREKKRQERERKTSTGAK